MHWQHTEPAKTTTEEHKNKQTQAVNSHTAKQRNKMDIRQIAKVKNSPWWGHFLFVCMYTKGTNKPKTNTTQTILCILEFVWNHSLFCVFLSFVVIVVGSGGRCVGVVVVDRESAVACHRNQTEKNSGKTNTQNKALSFTTLLPLPPRLISPHFLTPAQPNSKREHTNRLLRAGD